MTFDDFVKNNRGRLNLAAGFVLVFVLGFSCGFYYLEERVSVGAAIEIIDNGADCSSFFASGAVKGSVAVSSDTTQASSTVSSEDSGNISKSVTEEKLFAASKNSTLYHTRDCQYVKRIKEENVVWFSSREEAEATGKSPHSCVE